jgi:hypothetical protein
VTRLEDFVAETEKSVVQKVVKDCRNYDLHFREYMNSCSLNATYSRDAANQASACYNSARRIENNIKRLASGLESRRGQAENEHSNSVPIGETRVMPQPRDNSLREAGKQAEDAEAKSQQAKASAAELHEAEDAEAKPEGVAGDVSDGEPGAGAE